jgi:c-di-GMP-binding flagellar brake protein YcgR
MLERRYKRHKTSDKFLAKLILSRKARIKDISAGGICMETPERLETNRKYRIEMVSGKNERQWLKCEVIWTLLKNTITENDDSVPVYEVGLKFLELNNNEKSFINELVGEFN